MRWVAFSLITHVRHVAFRFFFIATYSITQSPHVLWFSGEFFLPCDSRIRASNILHRDDNSHRRTLEGLRRRRIDISKSPRARGPKFMIHLNAGTPPPPGDPRGGDGGELGTLLCTNQQSSLGSCILVKNSNTATCPVHCTYGQRSRSSKIR